MEMRGKRSQLNSTSMDANSSKPQSIYAWQGLRPNICFQCLIESTIEKLYAIVGQRYNTALHHAPIQPDSYITDC